MIHIIYKINLFHIVKIQYNLCLDLYKLNYNNLFSINTMFYSYIFLDTLTFVFIFSKFDIS